MYGLRLAVAALVLCGTLTLAGSAQARSSRMTHAAAEAFQKALTKAAPSGTCEPRKPCSVTSAKRYRAQARIVRAKAATLTAGSCRTGLGTLARNYDLFAKATTTYYETKGRKGLTDVDHAGTAIATFITQRFRTICVSP